MTAIVLFLLIQITKHITVMKQTRPTYLLSNKTF